jgi:hypothetical protein
MKDFMTGIHPHVDQLVSMYRLLKEQHSLGELVKTEHSTLLVLIVAALDARVIGKAISYNQVRTLFDKCSLTTMQRLGEGGGVIELEEEKEVGIPYEKLEGYIRIMCRAWTIFTYTFGVVFS